MTAIVIDPEFHAAIPPLSSEELQQLEENIRRDGCLDALVVWPVNDQEILLDGHKRYEICTRLGLPFSTTRIAMASREDAIIWIIQTQLGRRNLTDFARVELALKLKSQLAEQAKAKEHARKTGQTTLVNLPNSSATAIDTREIIAKLARVSGKTVDHVETILAHGAPEVVQAARANTISISAAVPLTGLPKPNQAAALEAARKESDGKKPSATITTAVVNRVQQTHPGVPAQAAPKKAAPKVADVVATVHQQLAQGKDPLAAVTHAFQQHDVIAPTPAMATAVAQATGRRVPIPATDGILHTGRTKEEEEAIGAKLDQNGYFFRALATLATLPDIHQLINDIPRYRSSDVNMHLARAIENLGRFAAAWKASNREND
jgi:ParB-like chromosome segregation protein Spo0J